MGYLDKEKLASLIEFSNKLSMQYDPISNCKITGVTILNNKDVSIQFRYIAQGLTFLLDHYELFNQKHHSTKLMPYLSPDEIKHAEISIEPISISKIAYNINKILNEDMKKIKATQITEWLLQHGYLQESTEKETSHKVCTDKSVELGITIVQKVNEFGNVYTVNLYNEYAQRFIYEHINDILNCI